MPKRKPLCSLCRTVRDDPSLVPRHVVHPQSERPGLYDVHGHAKCLECGAQWHRGPRGTRLVQ